MVPVALRERVLNNLRRQRTVTSVELLTELLDACIVGKVTNKDDVVKLLTDHGTVVSSSWIRAQCKHLSEVWEFLNPNTRAPSTDANETCSTTLAVCEPSSGSGSSLVTAVASTDPLPPAPPPPPPPPQSMLAMQTAMRKQWYTGAELPLVMPQSSDVPQFDRNDLYYTNNQAMQELLMEAETRRFENMLMFVKLTTGERRDTREYITWCRRRDFQTLARQVNCGEVRCNDYVTCALNKGSRFIASPICEDIGFLTISDIDNILYILEGYLDGYGTRVPTGLNPSEVPHLAHRSLVEMGGNLAALKSYSKWDESVKRTKIRVSKVNVLVEEAGKALHALQEWESDGADFALTEAFCIKWEKTCEDAIAELARAEREYTAACTARRHLTSKIVSALADAYVNFPYIAPTRLLKLRTILQAPEPDHVQVVRGCVEEMRKLLDERQMSVRKALIELELWDGRGHIPFFTRKEVNCAFREIARRIHPDKAKPDKSELPKQYQDARTCLHMYLERRVGSEYEE